MTDHFSTPRQTHQMQIIIDNYREFFLGDTQTSWYATVARAIIDSAVTYESKLQERPDIRHMSPADMNPSWAVPLEPIIEDQVGLVLVLCQIYISDVVRRVSDFRTDYSVFSAKPNVKGLPTTKTRLMKDYGRPIENTTSTDVELINALANHFKHREEASAPDSRIRQQQNRNSRIVESAGVDPEMNIYWARSLTEGVRDLGVADINTLDSLLTVVDNWKKRIGESIVELSE